MLHQRHHHLSSALNINVDLFLTTLHRTTMPTRARFKEQGVVVVAAVVEVETLFYLHEPLLCQRDDFPRRLRGRNNIASDLLHEEIIELETWCGPGAGETR